MSQAQLELRQKPRTLTEDALLLQTNCFNVSMTIKDGKHVAVFQNTSAVIDRGRFGRDIEMLSDAIFVQTHNLVG